MFYTNLIERIAYIALLVLLIIIVIMAFPVIEALFRCLIATLDTMTAMMR